MLSISLRELLLTMSSVLSAALPDSEKSAIPGLSILLPREFFRSHWEKGRRRYPFLDESVKEYHAVMRIGAATDTQDCTGRIIRQGDWEGLSPAVIEAAILSFIGKGQQVPPMFSALKRDGVPLYKLARKGEEVHREPRDIEIHSLVIDRLEPPDIAFTVTCSRGVYVRTLANDMGEILGSGAHLIGLRRSASGPFAFNDRSLPGDACSSRGGGPLG